MSVKDVNITLVLPIVEQLAIGYGLPSYEGYDRRLLQNVTYDINKNMRQWTWQVCTEFGWFQTPWTVHPLRSQFIALDYWKPFCEAVFGQDYIKGGRPIVDWYNSHYGGFNITGSKIVFANAIEDPW